MRTLLYTYFLLASFPVIAQQFSGGIGDGFSYAEVTDGMNFNSVGGVGDGFSFGSDISNGIFYFSGGHGDGFSYNELLNSNSSYYVGGIGDGFSFISLEPVIPPLLCTYVDNNWVGVNGDWSNPSNWSSGTVPDICNNVTIDDPFVVTINPGVDALARTLNLDGDLHIINGGSLSLDGQDTLGHVVEILGGRLYNQGLLAIENYGSGSVSRSGIRITSNGVLENNNTISIDSIGANTSHGIQIVNGIFTNESNSTLTIANGILANGYGIRNTDSLTNNGNISMNNFLGLGAIFNQSIFTNNGTIAITDVRGGILNQDSIFNYGTISGENISEFPGLKNSRVDSYLSNHTSGDVEMNNVSDSYMIDNIGSILNDGNISLLNTSIGGITMDGGTISNNGTLYCEFHLGIGIFMESSQLNNAGMLEIVDYSNGLFDGLKNTSQSSIINSGTIHIIKGL
ncbi:MAG: hypothetical protein HKN68_13930 [Saprospiraceae bacterium]|nr:hypothetical protein [Saprospiraceae bacterium]